MKKTCIILGIIQLLIGTILICHGQIQCEYIVSDIGAVLMASSYIPVLLWTIHDNKKR